MKLFKKSKPPMIVGHLQKDMTIKQGYNAQTNDFWFQITKYHKEPGTYEYMDADNKKVIGTKDVLIAEEEMRIIVDASFFKAFHGQAALMTWMSGNKDASEFVEAKKLPN